MKRPILDSQALKLIEPNEIRRLSSIRKSMGCDRSSCPYAITHRAAETVIVRAEHGIAEKTFPRTEYLCQHHAQEFASYHDLAFFAPLQEGA